MSESTRFRLPAPGTTRWHRVGRRLRGPWLPRPGLRGPWLLEPWRTRLLWLSLGLNAFAAASLAAPYLWHRPDRLPGFDMLIQRISRDLPPDQAELFRADMARERPWYDLGRQRLQEARTAVADSIGREPFDPGAVRTALGAMQIRLHEGAARFDDSLVMALGDLTPAARATLAQHMRRAPR